MLHSLSKTHPIFLNTFLILHSPVHGRSLPHPSMNMAIHLTVTFFLIRGIRYLHRGLIGNNENSYLSQNISIWHQTELSFSLHSSGYCCSGKWLPFKYVSHDLSEKYLAPGLKLRAGEAPGNWAYLGWPQSGSLLQNSISPSRQLSHCDKHLYKIASPEKTAAKWRQTARGETILLQNEVTAWSEI